MFVLPQAQGTQPDDCLVVRLNHSDSLPDIMPSFEQQYRAYLSMFDGVMKDKQALSLAKVKFKEIYHCEVRSTEYGGCLSKYYTTRIVSFRLSSNNTT